MSARATAAFAAALVALAPVAARGSAADAFENKVKPVSGQLYRKAGKLELTIPAGVVSVNDAFFTKYMAGAKLTYHLSESWSLGVNGSIGTSSATGSTSICSVNTDPNNPACKPAVNAQLNQVPGDIKWIAGGEVGFSPLYGKLNLFGEKALHFDLSLLVGADLVSYRDVLGATQANAGATPGTVSTPGGHVGIGARLFFARFMALRLELRDVFYKVSALPTGNLQTQLLAEAGLSFFIPVGHHDEP
ncbi:MAG TPA: outer membrane beta-barrel domain-containing protein [Anaeromyxobacteraceae bacterium]|nr:outer membrane beta-barrel domain-containing protein [Anaeromyxobacteraceae bacterium]